MTDRKPRILIAEDFEDNRIALRLMLNAAGYDASEAADGRAALIAAQQHHPDLILMDISLPELDGLEATRALRAQAAFAQLPIIILSAHDTDELRRDAAEAGSTDYVVKPFEFDDLRRVIEQHLA